MELTRRDALLALTGGGLYASAKLAEEATSGDATVDGVDLDTLEAVAEVVYPSSVEGSREFIETYVLGRQSVDEGYRSGLRAALAAIRRTSRRETGRGYASLDEGPRDEVLRATGSARAHPDPEGTEAQRVRYYVVDGLLYGFYATPRGAGLVGNENPTGYPGGIDVYQQPPSGE